MEQIEKAEIDSEFIKLDSLLKLANLVMSGGEAKLVIQEGLVTVNGEVEARRGRKLYPGDRVELHGQTVMIAATLEKAF